LLALAIYLNGAPIRDVEREPGVLTANRLRTPDWQGTAGPTTTSSDFEKGLGL